MKPMKGLQKAAFDCLLKANGNPVRVSDIAKTIGAKESYVKFSLIRVVKNRVMPEFRLYAIYKKGYILVKRHPDAKLCPHCFGALQQ